MINIVGRYVLSNSNDLSVLTAAGRILRKLQLYNLINGDRAYEAKQIASELGIHASMVPDAIRILRRNNLVSLEKDKIRLTDIALDSSTLRPEEIMWRPRFQSLVEAALICLDPAKGGQVFDKSVFIIMAYDDITNNLREPIREVCKKFGLTARFADDRTYADQVWDNVICYELCSKYGIALFHQSAKNPSGGNRQYSESYNLNVALELGVMLSWGRPCCLLKDKSLPYLQTDLIGWIYRECNFKDSLSVVGKIESFFDEKGLKKDLTIGNPLTT